MKLYNDFISEEVRYNLVHDDEYINYKRAQYNFWDFKEFNNPKTNIQKALYYIWKDVVDIKKYPNGGIEYWVNRDAVINGELNHPPYTWHQDVLEPKGYIPNTKWESGVLSCAYYPYSDCVGGFLELCNNKPINQSEFTKYCLSINHATDIEKIRPLTNRAVFFEPHIIHRVSKIYNGVRDCLASTVWEKKPLTFNNK